MECGAHSDFIFVKGYGHIYGQHQGCCHHCLFLIKTDLFNNAQIYRKMQDAPADSPYCRYQGRENPG